MTPLNVFFTPRGDDGFSGSVSKATVLVPGNDVVVLTDPIGQLFGISGDTFGQIEVRAPREKLGLLSVSSTIVDHMRAELVIAAIPTVWRGEGARLGATLLVPGVTSDSNQSSELILVETLGTDRSSILASLYDNGGNLLGQRTLNVPRYGQVAVTDVAAGFAGDAVLTTAVLVGQPTGGTSSAKRALIARLHGRASKYPSAHNEVEYVIPFTTNGSYGSSPTTSTLLGLSSSLAAPVDISLTFRNSKTGATSTATVTLSGGESLEFSDVIGELFGLIGAIQGTLSITADHDVRVYSRSLAAPVSGTTASTSGQNAVVPLDSLLLSGASANLRRLLYLDGINQSIEENAGSRWSVLVSELTVKPRTFRLGPGICFAIRSGAPHKGFRPRCLHTTHRRAASG